MFAREIWESVADTDMRRWKRTVDLHKKSGKKQKHAQYKFTFQLCLDLGVFRDANPFGIKLYTQKIVLASPSQIYVYINQENY